MENNFIHIITTRFLCLDVGYGDKILSEDWLSNAFNVFNNFLYKSLNNQSNKSFIFIFLIHDKVDIDLINRIFSTFTWDIKYKFIRLSEYNNLLKGYYKKYDYIIQTRIDYDDLIYYNAVNDVQKLIEVVDDYIIYGYNSGYAFNINNKLCYLFDNMYCGNGHMSCFLSIIVNTKKCTNIMSIISYNHTNPIKYFIENNIVNHKSIIQNSDNRTFIWIRHDNTASSSSSLPIYCKSFDGIIEDTKKIFGLNIYDYNL